MKLLFICTIITIITFTVVLNSFNPVLLLSSVDLLLFPLFGEKWEERDSIRDYKYPQQNLVSVNSFGEISKKKKRFRID